MTIDPAGTALADELIRAAGRFRDPASADRLFSILEKDAKFREAGFHALLAVSGYDQPIVDPDDELPDDRWLRDQHPRRDDLLARMLDRLSAPGDAKLLARLISGARWSRSQAVDSPLVLLASHPDDPLRREVVKALGWRLKKREGQVEPLRKALGHRDPSTQLLAAEGLARAGRPDGLNVLLASIDFATDLDDRRRAVLALGELADERALETLLKIAGEDGHVLQESAAEAIGHMGRSARAEPVFQLLERLAKGNTGVALSALKGLRWLDTGAGWQLIRDRATDPSNPLRAVAIELLGHHDDPATRDLLLKLVATLGLQDIGRSFDLSFLAVRRVFGPDSLEPDYAVLQNEDFCYLDDADEVMERIRDRGQPARLFAILPKCPEEVRDDLRECLLNRADLPIAEAKAALDSPDASTAALAAHILGRVGRRASDNGPAVSAALARWLAAWVKAEEPTKALTECVKMLVWAAGRMGVAGGVLEAVASDRPEDPHYRPIRREAVLALASGTANPLAIQTLESASETGDLETRSIASQAMAKLDPARAGAIAGRLLTDAVGFRRLTLEGKVPVGEIVRSAARNVHYQGVVLPDLIHGREVATLSAVLEDRVLPEAARLGAIEGLAAMGIEPAEAVLRRVGADAKEDEEVRKAAWRSLRRSKRARRKIEVKL